MRDCVLLSLRASGSRECAPDDRLRKAIHLAACGTMDCIVASLLAMTVGFVEIAPASDVAKFRMDSEFLRSRESLLHQRQHLRPEFLHRREHFVGGRTAESE